ncbi:MAG TPA: hypothetical protein VFQ16_06100 [Burkholderiaceae bacterium]|nr:hypothetical protein [Burkholderiaceae bacterium]
MPYATRHADGQIDALYGDAPSAGAEYLSADHPDVQAFLGTRGPGESFGRLDAEFVRVIEDVIDTLIARHIINITDLPEQAQAKLFARKSFRERSVRNALRLFDDGAAADVINDSRLGDLA